MESRCPPTSGATLAVAATLAPTATRALALAAMLALAACAHDDGPATPAPAPAPAPAPSPAPSPVPSAEQECERGDTGRALCGAAASVYASAGPRHDLRHALYFYELGCRARATDPESTCDAGFRLTAAPPYGDGALPDPGHAHRFALLACALSRTTRACDALADAAYTGAGDVDSDTRARATTRRCDPPPRQAIPPDCDGRPSPARSLRAKLELLGATDIGIDEPTPGHIDFHYTLGNGAATGTLTFHIEGDTVISSETTHTISPPPAAAAPPAGS